MEILQKRKKTTHVKPKFICNEDISHIKLKQQQQNKRKNAFFYEP